MLFNERIAALRAHARQHCGDTGALAEIEEHLDALQAEVAELLRRSPDPRPATVTVTAR